MILLFEVGNSNIVMGLADDYKITNIWRIRTNTKKTADEYAIIFNNYIKDINLDGIMISSVSPQLTDILVEYSKKHLDMKPIVVGPGIKTGLQIKLHNPKEIGADLVTGAIGAIYKYSQPAIIIDLGTATKLFVVTDNAFQGGIIAPGVEISLNALVNETALLPKISLDAPKNTICKDTVSCMQSGLVFGTAAMIDGMIEKIKEEYPLDFTIIATGGLSESIIPHCKHEIIIDKELLLHGLIHLYNKNM